MYTRVKQECPNMKVTVVTLFSTSGLQLKVNAITKGSLTSFSSYFGTREIIE